MILTILGLLLWSGAHLFKRVAPDARARMGDRGKGLIALLLILSVIMMVVGYRGWYGPVYWDRTAIATGINNLLVLFAFYLFAASGMKTRITRRLRHPQLTAIILWSIGHLLVNGDLPSIVLFGGLLVWAIAEIALINAQDSWTPPEPASRAKEIRAGAGALIVFGLVAAIHAWLGSNPFG